MTLHNVFEKQCEDNLMQERNNNYIPETMFPGINNEPDPSEIFIIKSC